jgi:hypothetical protein
LIDTVQKLGQKAWTRVASTLGNRSDVQCRWRYRFLAKKAEEARTEIRPISPLVGSHEKVPDNGEAPDVPK